jgi:voltage-gated potassium channel
MYMSAKEKGKGWSERRARLQEIIFEAETPAGKLYDVALIVCVTTSVIVVMLDSVASIRGVYGRLFYGIEWFFTILFTVEYAVRLRCVGKPIRYATSFFGVVDLLGVIPTYLSLLVAGTHYLSAIRFLRVLRTFRVLKLSSYQDESQILWQGLKASHRRITVFLFTVLTLVVVLGSLMYVLEGEENGFTSIPRSIYWAIVTMTTVGYGDISPQTPLGQTLAALVMILGYSIIVVPTGIVSVAVADAARKRRNTQTCPQCSAEGHDPDAVHCKHCGARL